MAVKIAQNPKPISPLRVTLLIATTSRSKISRTILVQTLLMSLLLSMASTAMAGREFPSDSDHKGIIKFDAYEVFPENREGNAVYQDQKIILSEPGKTITHVLPLPEEGRFLYVTRDETGKMNLGVKLKDTDLKPRITEFGHNVFFVVMVMNEVVYKKVYRVVQNNTVQDLLPSSKTADGVTAGKVGVLFYHVASINREGSTGSGTTDFNLRLHLVLFEEERLRHLDYPIINTLPSLKLDWEDETSASYTLADGRQETLSIAQFQ